METILGQQFRDWELVISDNYSEDGAWEFFQKFKADPRVVLFQSPRTGMYANWNNCFARARGRYLYVATSDDTARPELLERMLVPLEARHELRVAVCDFEAIDAKGLPIELSFDRPRRKFLGDWLETASIRDGKTEFLLQACFGTTWITMTSVLFRKDLLEQVGPFRTDRGSRADEEWTMRASLASDIAFVPGKLATWRIHESQATPKRPTRASLRTILNCLEAVIDDSSSGVPGRWKKVPGWRDLITHVWRTEYLDSFDLYRGVLWRNPGHFLACAGSAVANEPSHFCSQLVRGFSWSKQFSPDRIEWATRLISAFGAPWPPQKIDARWGAS